MLKTLTHYLKLLLHIILLGSFIFGSTLSAKEMTQAERNEMAAKLIPIITMLLMDGDSTPPNKPSLTTPLGSEVDAGTVLVEVNGEAGAKVFANGVQVGVIGSNGKATVALTFVNGVNAMSITLQDSAGNVSDALTFSVSYDAPPVITLNGDEDTYVVAGEGFTDLGAVATDANDGSVSVSVSGTVDDATVGDYNLTYTASDSKGHVATKIRRVHILPAGASSAVLPMDLTKVEGFNGATEPSKLAGEVSNQYWIQAFGALTEVELSAIVSNYPIVTIIGYSDTYGLLVEIPLDNLEAKSAIKSIELEEKVLNVRHRVYLGADHYSTNSISLPNDDVSGYYDDGDNWHLEYIDILSAWEITTGSSDVAVGVVDGGFYANHEDITIKTKNNFSRGIKDDHGTACASIIAADTNNGKGITGINWSSPLVVSVFKDFDANISYKAENYFRDIFELSEDHSKVKLVSCSYGPKPKEIEKAYANIKDQYDVTQKYKNKLFIYAAGNDNNNSELEFGALHFNSENYKNMSEKDNVLVVAAVLKDGTLPYYSNYGKTVDIAAPTSMKTAKKVVWDIGITGGYWRSTYKSSGSIYYGTDHSMGYELVDGWWVPKFFNGTSAATPVVTGVASLIYSLNPDFTPQEVKKILLDSTGGKKACLRHKKKRYLDGEEETEEIPGGHCIPILNAGAALALAKQIVDAKKASLSHYYPSVFSNICNVYVNPPTQLSIESLELSVQGQKRTDGIWESIPVNPSDSSLSELSDNSHELAFHTDRKYSQYKISGTLTYAGFAPIDVNLTFEHTLVEDFTEIKDKLSHEYLTGVEVMLYYTDGFASVGNSLGAGKIIDNNVTVYLEKERRYKVTIKKDNYKTYTGEEYRLEGADFYSQGIFEMVDATAEAKGNLIVLVWDENASGIANASVALGSNSAIINNIPNTGSSGIARILDIPILDSNDTFISYTLEVTRAGYLPETVVGVALVDGKSPLLNITLQKDPNYTVATAPTAVNDNVSNANLSTPTTLLTLVNDLDIQGDINPSTVNIANPGATDTDGDGDNDSLVVLGEGTWTVDNTTGDITFTPEAGFTADPSDINYTVTDNTGFESNEATESIDYLQSGTITHNGTTYGTVTSPYTGKVWLDRNLGASRVCTSFDDAACYGDYYQWGRNFDGHQDANSTTASTQNTDVNSAGSSFITATSSPYDWTTADSNGSLRSANWSKTDGTSVCPVGFRVPTIAELKAELLDAGSAQIANNTDAFNSFLKLPAVGGRYYAASLSNQGSWGYVWSSSVDGSYSHYVYFGSGDADTRNDYRANGFTVRCLRD